MVFGLAIWGAAPAATTRARSWVLGVVQTVRLKVPGADAEGSCSAAAAARERQATSRLHRAMCGWRPKPRQLLQPAIIALSEKPLRKVRTPVQSSSMRALLISGVALLTAAASGTHVRSLEGDTLTPRRRIPRQQPHLRRSLPQPHQLMQLRGGGAPGYDEPVLLIADDDALDYELELAGSKLVVLDFYADWCGPCKKLAPVLDDLALQTASSNKVVFLKCDVDASRELAQKYSVKSMPTILFFRNGKKVDSIVGADVPALKEKVMRVTRPAILRVLRSERLIVAGLALYLAIPWQKTRFAWA